MNLGGQSGSWAEGVKFKMASKMVAVSITPKEMDYTNNFLVSLARFWAVKESSETMI